MYSSSEMNQNTTATTATPAYDLACVSTDKFNNSLTAATSFEEKKTLAVGFVQLLRRTNGLKHMDDCSWCYNLDTQKNNEVFVCVADALLDEFGATAFPFLIRMLPACMTLVGAKNGSVRQFSETYCHKLYDALPPEAFVMPTQVNEMTVASVLISSVDRELSWQTRVLALTFLAGLANKAPTQMADIMDQIIPAVMEPVTDTKKQVTVAALNALTKCTIVIGNSDLAPRLMDIVSCVKDQNKTAEVLHLLAGTAFVQTVETQALAICVPLLVRGLREKKVGPKRQTCQIIMNMAKLVGCPSEAAPFLPRLVPGIEKAIDTIADPEARGVAEKALAQMHKLQHQVDMAKEPALTCPKFANRVREAVGLSTTADDDATNQIIQFVASIGYNLAKNQDFSEVSWHEKVTPFITLLADDVPSSHVMEITMALASQAEKLIAHTEDEDEEDDDGAEVLCDCNFTLAYGTKILLHNTDMKLKRGYKYGVLGPNDCGKSTLLRSIANGSVEGFPDADECRTVFVEADIIGEQSHLNCIEYVLANKEIVNANITAEQVTQQLANVGFDGVTAGPTDTVSTLSGGWRMKLALARAMLQQADILLMDEPTNHLDVMNVAWVMNYLKSLTQTTCIMVSTHKGLLTEICDNILEFEGVQLKNFRGNLNAFKVVKPECEVYFTFKASRLAFTFPNPGPIDGVRSKGKALIKVQNVSFCYPGNEKNTIEDATCQVSLSSRVACVGPNGAGKSTLIKVLTGETVPTTGTVWQHTGCKMGYIAQHAFHHIESHLNKTPNEYIRWRYSGGEDKEAIAKDTMKVTDDELTLMATAIQWLETDEETGKQTKSIRVVHKLTGERKDAQRRGQEDEYEVKWKDMSNDSNSWLAKTKLERMGWAKYVATIDLKITQQEGMYKRPLTTSNVETHLINVGLASESATHTRIGALSGGEKVKVVLGAALWMCPHLIILDEPTNYLDRESLGALAGAIEKFEGGVVIISHNDEFCQQLCPETWVVERDEDGISRPNIQGDAEWMANAVLEKVDDSQVVQEMVDAAGNVSKTKVKKNLSKKDIKKMKAKVMAKVAAGLELDSDEEGFAFEHDL